MPASVRPKLIENYRFAVVVSLMTDLDDSWLDLESAIAAWDVACPFLRPRDVQYCHAVARRASSMFDDANLGGVIDHDGMVGVVAQLYAICADAQTCARALGPERLAQHLRPTIRDVALKIVIDALSRDRFDVVNAVIDHCFTPLEYLMQQRILNLRELCTTDSVVDALFSIRSLGLDSVRHTMEHMILGNRGDLFVRCIRAASGVAVSECRSTVSRALHDNTRELVRVTLYTRDLETMCAILRDPVFDQTYYGEAYNISNGLEPCSCIVDGLLSSCDLMDYSMLEEKVIYSLSFMESRLGSLPASGLYLMIAVCTAHEDRWLLIDDLMRRLQAIAPADRDVGEATRKRAIGMLKSRKYIRGRYASTALYKLAADMFGTQPQTEERVTYAEERALLAEIKLSGRGSRTTTSERFA